MPAGERDEDKTSEGLVLDDCEETAKLFHVPGRAAFSCALPIPAFNGSQVGWTRIRAGTALLKDPKAG